MKLLEDNRRKTRKPGKPRYGDEFQMNTKRMNREEIADELDFIRMKNCCSVKDNFRRMTK